MSFFNYIFSNTALCDFGPSTYIFLSSNVPPLIYYSHLPIAFISIFLGTIIFLKDRKSLPNRMLFCLTLAFSAWVFLDSIFWASNRSDVIMFVWSLQILFEPIVYIGALYFIYVVINKKDISFGKKLIIALIYLPVIIFVPTRFSLSGFNVSSCLSEEGPIALYYTYAIEIFYTLWIMGFVTKEFLKTKTRETKKQIMSLTIGTILLLISFASGNIISSFTENWNYAQIGLFTMPVFIAFLAYSIVRFRLFNVKVIGANIIVIALWVATASLFAVQDIDTSRAVVAATLILITIFGFILINSVRREVSQREEMEKLAGDLKIANERQENLIHFINHQVKGFFTKSKYIYAGMLEGDYGALNKEMEFMVKEGLKSDNEGVAMVEDILNASNIKSGVMEYSKSVMDFKELVLSVVSEQKKNAEAKGLSFETDIKEEDFKMSGDEFQLRHVVKNLIDNSVKYTPTGKVTVSLSKYGGKILFSVKDTGVGISNEDKKKLFTEGGKGKNSQKVNVDSTGFGLFIAKNIVEAHNGKIWAESEGEGKGSQFWVELSAGK